MRTIEEIKGILDRNISVMKERIDIINSPDRKNTWHLSLFERSGKEIVALMLEAKSHSKSREDRKAKGDNYQPFIVTSNEAKGALKSIVAEKQRKKEPFRFDFLYNDESEWHWTPMQIIFDGVNMDLFSIDAYGSDRIWGFGDIKPCNFYSYHAGEIQKGPGCHIFAIQNLNVLNNITIEEKKKSLTGRYEDLDPRFLKITQSLSKVPDEKKSGVISKPGKEEQRTLGQSLDASSIVVGDRLQNRYFDKIFYKYLLAAKQELDILIEKGGDQLAIETIKNRLELSESRHNTYQPHLATGVVKRQPRSVTEVIKQIKDCEYGVDVIDIIGSLGADAREQLLDKQGVALKDKMKEFPQIILNIIEGSDVDVEVVKFLLKAGADVNAADEGQTPLMEAVQKDDIELVKCLINAGANVNARGEVGNTALHQAVMLEGKDAVVALLKAGADPDLALDKEGDIPDEFKGKTARQLKPELFLQPDISKILSERDKKTKDPKIKQVYVKTRDFIKEITSKKMITAKVKISQEAPVKPSEKWIKKIARAKDDIGVGGGPAAAG